MSEVRLPWKGEGCRVGNIYCRSLYRKIPRRPGCRRYQSGSSEGRPAEIHRCKRRSSAGSEGKHILRLGECRQEMYFLEHEIRRRKRSSGEADCRCGCIYLQLASGTAEESRSGLGNPPRKVSGTGIRLCFRIRRSGTGQRSAGIRFHRILCKRRNSGTSER